MVLLRSAKVVILDVNHHALILRRSGTHPYAALNPDLPGGVIEEHETFEAGIIREIMEETGIVVEVNHLRLLRSTESRLHNRMMYVIYLDSVAPAVTLSWEHDQYTWVPVAEVGGLESPSQIVVDYSNEHDVWTQI